MDDPQVKAWGDAIVEVRALLHRSARAEADVATINFAIADRVNEVAPAGAHGVNTGRNAKLQRFADEVPMAFGTLKEIAHVGNRFTDDVRTSSAPWSAYQLLASVADPGQRVALLRSCVAEAEQGGVPLTKAKVTEAIKASKAKQERDHATDHAKRKAKAEKAGYSSFYGMRNPTTPEDRANVVRKHLIDPEVRALLMEDEAKAKEAAAARKVAAAKEREEVRRFKEAEREAKHYSAGSNPTLDWWAAEAKIRATGLVLAGLTKAYSGIPPRLLPIILDDVLRLRESITAFLRVANPEADEDIIEGEVIDDDDWAAVMAALNPGTED